MDDFSALKFCGALFEIMNMDDTVRDMVMGSQVGFVARGEHALKGIEGEWRLYAVDGAG